MCVISKKTQKKFALKIISKRLVQNLRMQDQLKTEVEIMKSLDHENIIRNLTNFEDSTNIYLLMELAEEGHLYYRLKKSKFFDEKTSAKYMFDILKAVNYLHERDPPIIHRDIKAENILFFQDRLKLADFGWSSIKNKVRTTFCGTPDYLAPEMILERGHNEKLDLWTLGILMFELLVGKAPFSPDLTKFKDQREAHKTLEKNILKMKPDFSLAKQPVSQEAKKLITWLLQKKS